MPHSEMAELAGGTDQVDTSWPRAAHRCCRLATARSEGEQPLPRPTLPHYCRSTRMLVIVRAHNRLVTGHSEVVERGGAKSGESDGGDRDHRDQTEPTRVA
jgi:hypothetical protein